jgi:hypothetical protein
MELGIVYLIREKGKPRYVGQTFQTLSKRWESHKEDAKHKKKTPLHVAMSSHLQDFSVQEIERANSPETLDLFEKYWICKFNTQAPDGYNVTKGGQGRHTKLPGNFLYSELIEEVKRVVQEISTGSVVGQSIDPKTSFDRLRFAPSFVMGKNTKGIAYTAFSVAQLLGRTKRGSEVGRKRERASSSVVTALNALALVEVGVLKEEDLESISVPTISSLWAKHRKK